MKDQIHKLQAQVDKATSSKEKTVLLKKIRKLKMQSVIQK